MFGAKIVMIILFGGIPAFLYVPLGSIFEPLMEARSNAVKTTAAIVFGFFQIIIGITSLAIMVTTFIHLFF